MAEIEARYFDGKTARDVAARVSLGFHSLTIAMADGRTEMWSFEGLRAVDPPRSGKPLRLAHENNPGARLVIPAGNFKTDLLAAAPALHGLGTFGRLKRIGGIAVASLAATLALGYLLFTYAPQRIAFLLPESWREELGRQVEASFVSEAQRCTNVQGVAALEKLAARMVDGNPDLPEFTLQVFNIPVTNAFALPGGKIVIFNQLIQRADAAEEVAGVLAHEIGHIANRHAEAQLVRAIGLQLVLSLASGGGGDAVGGLAGTLAILSYSRGAEVEADTFAQTALNNAEIDPLGLKRFFERLAREEGEPLKGVFGRIGNALSTHPGTADRIAAIKPLATTPRPAMTEADWQALRGICR